jgi:hypothetical protein
MWKGIFFITLFQPLMRYIACNQLHHLLHCPLSTNQHTGPTAIEFSWASHFSQKYAKGNPKGKITFSLCESTEARGHCNRKKIINGTRLMCGTNEKVDEINWILLLFLDPTASLSHQMKMITNDTMNLDAICKQRSSLSAKRTEKQELVCLYEEKHMIWVNPKVFQQINKRLNVFCVYQACEDPIPSIQGQNHQQQSVKSPHHHNPSNSRPSHKTINKDWRPKRN